MVLAVAHPNPSLVVCLFLSPFAVPPSPILAATFMPPRGRPTLVVLPPVQKKKENRQSKRGMGPWVGCPQDPKENSFSTQKGTHEANLMLASSNRSEASSVGGPST